MSIHIIYASSLTSVSNTSRILFYETLAAKWNKNRNLYILGVCLYFYREGSMVTNDWKPTCRYYIYNFLSFILKQVQLKMTVTQSVDQVLISLVSFPSDLMVSLTTLAPWIQLKKINHGVLHLLMITTIMCQVEGIMEIVDQNVHCLVGQNQRKWL